MASKLRFYLKPCIPVHKKLLVPLSSGWWSECCETKKSCGNAQFRDFLTFLFCDRNILKIPTATSSRHFFENLGVELAFCPHNPRVWSSNHDVSNIFFSLFLPFLCFLRVLSHKQVCFMRENSNFSPFYINNKHLIIVRVWQELFEHDIEIFQWILYTLFLVNSIT